MENKPIKLVLSALDTYGGHPFDELADVVMSVYAPEDVGAARELTDKLVLVIWGGEDISPAIYGQVGNQFTGAPDKPSSRDKLEIALAEKAMKLNIPIVGVCRGAQLMCALSGGTLVQHVTGHVGGYHEIVTNKGEKFNCPSLHHQMMFPWEIKEFEMLAWPPKPRSAVYKGQPDDESLSQDGMDLTLLGEEPEIIWIPSTKSLCIQSHPEFIHDVKHPFVQHCLKLTETYCGME